jgi:anion-transporting  ArsA/GET3 family ATPase
VTAWLSHRVLVTVGTGGVGKTTVAAALALEGARRGRRALVLTIDPARRLADALGVGELDNEPREVPPELLARVGVRGGGRLFAMMLDTKRTFDELVARLAPDAASRERIYANAIYRNLSDALAGSREYSALEKLCELAARPDYDLIVVDTPPAEHALEFLDAPRRLTGFLESPLLRALLTPAARVGRLLRGGTDLVLRALERVTGLEFLASLSDLLLAFEKLIAGFAARAHQVHALLRSPECGFLLVAGPEPGQLAGARVLSRRLHEEGIRLVGLIVNRVHAAPASAAAPGACQEPDLVAWLSEGLAEIDPGLAAAASAQELSRLFERATARAQRDARICAALAQATGLEPRARRIVPLLPREVRALEALDEMGSHLFRETN